MAGLPKTADPNLLVGYDSSDDAAVYKVRFHFNTESCIHRWFICNITFFWMIWMNCMCHIGRNNKASK